MPVPCEFCEKPVLLSKHDYRTQHVQKDGVWVVLTWHMDCDPYETVVTTKKKARGRASPRPR